ncbi:hypothetical protein LIER_35732 [Lithospermum erythrorhizon]|uniref:Uncharacterized protein n=1 Tax=Lithospermum erythrorhizon TaxID=34254 RepID=A0AAV3NW62_LITER
MRQCFARVALTDFGWMRHLVAGYSQMGDPVKRWDRHIGFHAQLQDFHVKVVPVEKLKVNHSLQNLQQLYDINCHQKHLGMNHHPHSYQNFREGQKLK